MNKNLGWKLLLIVGTLLVFLYGIFGVPKGASGAALSQAILDRINLGLDLKGGTHLILQVQVNDAVNADTDRAIERLKDSMSRRKINYADLSKPDPVNHPEQVTIKGVPPANSSDLRTIVQDRLPEYDLSSGAGDIFTVSMKPSVLSDLKNRAVQQAIETIRNRIDKLGISEPIIQE